MTIIIQDSFNRANTTSSTTGWGSTEIGSKQWIPQQSAYNSTATTGNISSNQAVLNGDDRGFVVDCGVSDYSVSVKFAVLTTNPQLIVRANQASKSYFYLEYQTGALILFEMSGGAGERGRASTTITATDTIKTIVSGSTIAVYVNSTLMIRYTTATSNQTSTYAGLGSGNGNSIFDDFLVEELPIAYDTFTRADNPSSLGATEIGNKTWSVYAGTGSIFGNNAKLTNNSDSIATVDSGVKDCTITLKFLNVFYGGGIVFRQQDIGAGVENCYHIQIETSTMTLYRRPSWQSLGANSLYNSNNAPGAYLPVGSILKVVLNGSSIKVYVNETLAISATDSTYINNTRHGLGAWNQDISYDSFIIESLPPSGTAYTKSLSDTVAFSDSLTKIYTPASSGTAYTKSLSDSIVFSETFSKIASRFKTLTDSVGSTDSMAKTVSRFKTLNDGVTLSESLTKSRLRTLTDFITGVDSLTKGTSRSVSDSVSYTDSKSKLGSKALTDFIIESDSISRPGNKSLTDSIVVSDSLAKLVTKSMYELINQVDSLSKLGKKSLSETISQSDSLTRLRGKTLTDSIATSDSISKRLSIVVIDTIATSEVENDSVTRNLVDNVASTDSLAKQLKKAIQDSVITAESINQQGGSASVLSDSVAITDTIRKALTKLQSDTVSTSEVEQDKVTKTLLDNLASSDVIFETKGKVILLSDNLTPTDSLTKAKSRTILLSDGVTVADLFSRAVMKFKTDGVDLTDYTSKISNVSVKLYDVIVTTDEIDVFNPNAPALIGTVHLRGEHILNVYLVGEHKLDIELEGGIEVTATSQNFTMYSGESKNIVIPVTGDTKELDLIGSTAIWRIKKTTYSTDSLLELTDSSIIITKDKVIVRLGPDDTKDINGTLYHECELTDSRGNVSVILTGTLIINRKGKRTQQQ